MRGSLGMGCRGLGAAHEELVRGPTVGFIIGFIISLIMGFIVGFIVGFIMVLQWAL